MAQTECMDFIAQEKQLKKKRLENREKVQLMTPHKD